MYIPVKVKLKIQFLCLRKVSHIFHLWSIMQLSHLPLLFDFSSGHYIYLFQVKNLALTPVTCSSDVPVAIHGTYHAALENIMKQGLSRMTRQHVHFAPGEPGEDGVISGMRKSCQIYIYLNIQKLLHGKSSSCRTRHTNL